MPDFSKPVHRRPIQVLVDLDRLREPASGLGHVAISLGRQFAALAEGTNEVRFTFLLPKKDVGRFGQAVGYVACSPILKIFPWLHKRYDVWYCPHQDVSFSPPSGVPFIMTINDLNFIHEKKKHRIRARLARIQKWIDRSSRVTVISAHTGKEVRENLSAGDRNLEVIPFGLELKMFDAPREPAFVPASPFFLTVGVHKKTKNYQALIGLMEQLPECALVMIGKSDTPAGQEFRDALEGRGLTHRVHVLGAVSDEEKYWYYSRCQAVFFPSTSEGMGYPPLEAMQMRRPVFAFSASAIPEICGAHALYWSSSDPQAMAREVREKLAWYEGNSQFIEAAWQHGMSFSWEKVAAAYVNLFKEICKISP
ncbi:MAG: hypothetical protein RIR26_922 [Pseudomonadota bacterium]|jgi:glycosyltransferase involved in cell wall biosynthesis